MKRDAGKGTGRTGRTAQGKATRRRPAGRRARKPPPKKYTPRREFVVLAAVGALALAALVRVPSTDATPDRGAKAQAGLTPLEVALTRLQNAFRPEDHKRVLAELAEQAEHLAAPLPALLDHPEHPLIVPGLELAGVLGLEDALPKILGLAERPTLRIPALSAADAIAPLPEEELVALLADPDAEMVLAALAMARRREHPPLRALVSLLDHAMERVAATALTTLPQRLPEGLRHELELLTLDDRQEVRTRAYQALLRIEQEPVAAPDFELVLDGPDLRRTIDSVVGTTEKTNTHADLVRQLDARDEDARIAALEGLSVLAKPEDAERIAALLLNPNPVALQKQACLFLGRVRHRAAVRDLIDVLREATDAGLKANALWSLQQTTGLQLNRDPELWELWWRRSGGEYASSPR